MTEPEAPAFGWGFDALDETRTGEVLTVPAGAVHSVRNVGTTEGSELATYIVEKGKKLLTVVE